MITLGKMQNAEKDKIEGSFQVVSSQIQEGFWLLSESINKPLFEPKEIDKVKKQIVASIKIDKSNVQTQASEKFNKLFFLLIYNMSVAQDHCQIHSFVVDEPYISCKHILLYKV